MTEKMSEDSLPTVHIYSQLIITYRCALFGITTWKCCMSFGSCLVSERDFEE